MNLIEPILWGCVGGAAYFAVQQFARWLKRRRQPKKPWVKAPGPAIDHDPRRQRTAVSIGKASVRKTKARIGTHRRLNR